MTAALGGPADFVDNYTAYIEKAPVVRPVYLQGYLEGVDTRAVGHAIIELGGGRRSVGETLDLSVGLDDFAPIGTMLDAERPLAVVHAANEADADAAEQNLVAACRTSSETPADSPVIYEILDGDA